MVTNILVVTKRPFRAYCLHILSSFQNANRQRCGDSWSGFKNPGQCVAAAHVAKNLDIPGGFDGLTAKMTGSTSVSLGKAIQELAPDAGAKAEAKKAKKQTSDDLKESPS